MNPPDAFSLAALTRVLGLTPLLLLEGLDGCGKDTQADRLAARLGVEKQSFPRYETPAGRLIRGLLRGQVRVESAPDRAADPGEEALVLQALMTWDKRTAPVLTERRTAPAVLVRSWDSAAVYGAADGLDYEDLRVAHAGLAWPDRALLLQVPIEEAVARLKARGGPPERYENAAKLGEVDTWYRVHWARMQQLDSGPLETYRVVDGTGTVEEVEARIWKALFE